MQENTIQAPKYNRLKKGDGKRKNDAYRQPLPMKNFTIDKIIYPVKTKKGIRLAPPDHSMFKGAHEQQQNLKLGRLLDGFLILFSCRVKLPHEAISSKLTSQQIVEVIEEDLAYFQNLNSLDLSDNRVRLEQLKNLKSLTELNLQYNQI